jgi:hypothetical protein
VAKSPETLIEEYLRTTDYLRCREHGHTMTPEHTGWLLTVDGTMLTATLRCDVCDYWRTKYRDARSLDFLFQKTGYMDKTYVAQGFRVPRDAAARYSAQQSLEKINRRRR